MKKLFDWLMLWLGYVPAADYREVAERMRKVIDKEITLKDMVIENGGVSLAVSHELCGIMADSFLKMLDEGQAPNYMEMTFKKRGEFDPCIIVTVQRAQGKTPHQLRMEAEERALRAQEGKILRDHYATNEPQSHGDTKV